MLRNIEIFVHLTKFSILERKGKRISHDRRFSSEQRIMESLKIIYIH